MISNNNQITPSLTPMGDNTSVKETNGEMNGQSVNVIESGDAQAIVEQASVENKALTVEANIDLGDKESFVMEHTDAEFTKYIEKETSEESKNEKVLLKTQLQQNISNKTCAEMLKDMDDNLANTHQKTMKEIDKTLNSSDKTCAEMLKDMDDNLANTHQKTMKEIDKTIHSSDAKMAELSKVHKATVEAINQLKDNIQTGRVAEQQIIDVFQSNPDDLKALDELAREFSTEIDAQFNFEMDKFWNDSAIAHNAKLDAEMDTFWNDRATEQDAQFNSDIDKFWNAHATEHDAKFDAKWDDFVIERSKHNDDWDGFVNERASFGELPNDGGSIDGVDEDLMLFDELDEQIDETDFILNPSNDLKSTKVYKETSVVALLDKLLEKLDTIRGDADQQKDSGFLKKSIDAITALRNILAHVPTEKVSSAISITNPAFENADIDRSEAFVNPAFGNDEIDIDPNDNINTKLAYDKDDLESTDL